jgi:hypothetical protein
MRIDEHAAHRVCHAMLGAGLRRMVPVMVVMTMMLLVAVALLGSAPAARPCCCAALRSLGLIIVIATGVIMIMPVRRLAAAARSCARWRVLVGGAGILVGHQGLLSSAFQVAYTFPRW